jgi:alpha-N-arabinofuranosidase
VFGSEKIPAVSASATRSADGKTVHLSLANTTPGRAVPLTVTLTGLAPAAATGRILTAPAMQAHNTFAAPDEVRPVPFDGVKLAAGSLSLTLPAKSVVVVELR